MQNMIQTLAIGAVCGLVLWKLKFPGGMMVGALIGVSIFNVTTGMAHVSVGGRVLAQTTAGAFIACSVSKKDLLHMRYLWKPGLTMLSCMLAMNIIMGVVIHAITDLDWVTSLCSAIPGGITDVPIIAADMGANGSKVAVLQFARMMVGTSIFPSAILFFTRNEPTRTVESRAASVPELHEQENTPVKNNRRSVNIVWTLGIALIFGVIGYRLKIPAGAIVLPLVGVIVFKLATDRAYLPTWVRRSAQILSGAYIGCSVTKQDVLELGGLVIPAIILLCGYMIACFLIALLLKRLWAFTMREGMLTATPAGASDMALISADIGVNNPDVMVLQVMRMVTVVVTFPQVIHLMIVAMAL